MIRTAALALFLPLVACAPQQSVPFAVLPQDATTGVGDPTRAAIIGGAYTFTRPHSIAGQPAAAARAVAQLEYLATEIPTGPRWTEFSPLVGMELHGARQEMRGALGIAPTAQPQLVVDGLFAASRALRAGDGRGAEQALVAPAFADGRVTLARLQTLSPTPRAQTAMALAMQELNRLDQDRQATEQNGDGGGKD
jgi:hypothetical protein